MWAQFRPAVLIFLWLTLLTGVIYPLVVTGVAQTFFSEQARGSVLIVEGRPIGSRLIGQNFDAPGYFWGRPSATGPTPYTAFNSTTGTGSSGSNLGPSNPALLEAVKGRVEALRAADPTNTQPVPVDLVTASGSGLDPEISPAAALYQVARVARARKFSESVVNDLVQRYTESRTFGILGEPRVNVLQLNLALDELK